MLRDGNQESDPGPSDDVMVLDERPYSSNYSVIWATSFNPHVLSLSGESKSTYKLSPHKFTLVTLD